MNQLLSGFCSCSTVELTPLLSFLILCRKSKGKPNGKKPAPEEKKLYLEPEYTKSRITDFEFKELVMLPREIDLNEWLASNSEYYVHTALRLLSILKRPFIHSFCCSQCLEKHSVTIYAYCVMHVIIPWVVIKLSHAQPSCAQQHESLDAFPPFSLLLVALRALQFWMLFAEPSRSPLTAF